MFKSMDYLKELKGNAIITNEDLADVLDNIAYILADNGYENAREFLDELSEAVSDNEIEEIKE